MNFDWNRARAFLATARRGTLSAAGKALNLSQPTVGRQIAALEEELGIALFERRANRLLLTPAGRDLMAHVQAMEEAANRVLLTASGRSEELAGTVSITASEAISGWLLTPVLRGLRRDFPAIQIDLVATNHTRDLLKREADIAVRNFRPSEPDLVAQRLHPRKGWLYATPALLDRCGVKAVADLSRCEFLGWDRGHQLRDGLNAMGLQLTDSNFPVATPHHLVQWQLCKAGIGIGVMMEEVGDRDPDVVRVLPAHVGPFPVEMWLTAHRDVRSSARVRVVYDRVLEALG